MVLKIYNTLTHKKEAFVPLTEGKVNMYVCGMTVYDYCHLGHARVLVAFDVITRFLKASGFEVNYVRNITDIDDKILRRAEENNEPYHALTERFIKAMHEDEARLGVERPTQEPRATQYIDNIINMIEELVNNGSAYVASNGDVYFSVTSFANYGALSRKKLDDLLAGARVDVEEAKQDPRDFALWKAAKEGEVSWESPWGIGRPGWHIECSAMSTCCLGNHFDIHGGGPDLVFPHHENEIAQSESATGETYANTWMHAGAVRVNDEKMSKSLGNFFTIREILDKYHPEVVRYFLISSHYRSPINYSEENLQTAKNALDRFYTALREYPDAAVLPASELDKNDDWVVNFFAIMSDDFNTPKAVALLFEMVRELNSNPSEQLACTLKSLGSLLGILQEQPTVFLQNAGEGTISAEDVEALIAERVQAKLDKNYARCDEIRAQLQEQGIVLEDSSEGTRWRRNA